MRKGATIRRLGSASTTFPATAPPPSALARAVAAAARVLAALVAAARRARAASGGARPAGHEGSGDEDLRSHAAADVALAFHDAARVLAGALEVDAVLDAVVDHLRATWTPSGLAVLVRDDASGRWLVLRQAGVALPPLLSDGDLPPVLRAAASAGPVVRHDATGAGPVAGLDPCAGEGVYVPLRARDEVVGLLAVERPAGQPFGHRDVRLVEGFAGAAALALDTACCVDRVRSAGADAERARIAGELHDRVGQSLAYLGFELDRLSRHSPDEELRPGIDEVRTGLRAAMGELRDALHDLRADVSERRSLEEVLESVVPRVRRRTGAEVTFERSGPEGAPARLPLVHERALWRIAEEALTNAERHATAGAITVRWHCDGVRATLEVVDDGRGFDPDAVGALPARHGLAGMRRRAASVGATVEVRSAPGAGTLVRCRLGQP